MSIKWICEYCKDAAYYTDACVAEIQEGCEPTTCVLATSLYDYNKAKWERIPLDNENQNKSDNK